MEDFAFNVAMIWVSSYSKADNKQSKDKDRNTNLVQMTDIFVHDFCPKKAKKNKNKSFPILTDN